MMNEAETKCWEELAGAIVAQAGIDYLKAKRALYNLVVYDEATERKKKRLEGTINECTRFFKSKWYRDLRNTNGQWFLEQLDEAFDHVVKTGNLDRIDGLTLTIGI